MIYLDHNATSPLQPEVREAMLPWLGVPANPASVHQAGQAAMVAVEEAREHIAALVGAKPSGVVLTSGATEANHLFLRGCFSRPWQGRLVTSSIEHPCVTGAAEWLQEQGVQLTKWGADQSGRVRVEACPEDTRVVSVMTANHETGVIQPLAEVISAAQKVGAFVHTDATQAAGRIPLSMEGLTALTMSAHKLGGPSGVGALILPDGEPFPALFQGSQERSRRGGTVNTAGAVGFGVACQLARQGLEARQERWTRLRDRFEAKLRQIGGRIVGGQSLRVPNTTCVVFPGLRGESLVQALDLRGICTSAGAACSSGSLQPSPTLTAMGDPNADGVLRVSMGPHTTQSELDELLTALPGVVEALRFAAEWDEPLP